ncbi:MAG: vWA domain-containing protein [Gemmatimonadaceae bacterium]
MIFAGVYFDYIWLLPLAVVLPVLVIILVRYNYRRRFARLARLGTPEVVSRLVPPNAMRPPGWHVARVATAAIGVGIAVAGPRWGAERNVVRTSGIDMVLALDASLSMQATDERPSRLERMKQEVRRLLDQSRGDRTGLIAFAGRSYILTPMTVDGGALALFLDNLDPSVVGQAGSSLARAIRQGADLLMLSNSGADKALVLMSDGEAFEDVNDVIAEAKRAGDQGISLVTVGFGTTQGTTIPVKNPDGSTTQKRDENGQIVVTHYSPDFLKAAADAAHGTFIDASRTDKAALVKSALARLRTKARATISGESRTPRYQLFLLPAVLLLLFDTLLGERRGRRRRRSAAAETSVTAAAMMLIMLLPKVTSCAGVLPSSSPTEKGATAYRSKNYQQAAQLYRGAIDAGDKRPELLYNYGTALLAGDSLPSAVEALERLADAQDPELRYRALFNLGLAHLKTGLAAPKESANESLDAALAAYKKVLLMRSADLDAKWNYELALRKREQGGGGGGGGSGGGQSNSSPQEQQPQPSGGLGQQQADQLLGSAAREERDVQAKKQKQTRVEPPPGGKDW